MYCLIKSLKNERERDRKRVDMPEREGDVNDSELV